MRKRGVEEKAKRFEVWRGSGKSVWAYAKEQGISPQTLREALP
jgi:hypothetical protein